MSSPSERFPAQHTLALFLLGLLVHGLAARWIGSPGYMDADYYFATATQLQRGQGFEDPFLWNYLDDPQGIPHPSHQYWMPAPSLIAAAGLAVFGDGFRAAQVPFILLAASLPAVIAQLSWQLHANRRYAWMAGLLAAFPGFFLPFLVTTDGFALYALVGGLALWSFAAAARQEGNSRWLVAGLLVGMAHLARADAPLLLFVGVVIAIRAGGRRPRMVGMLLAGYLLMIGPWWVRNYTQTGSLLNPGSSQLLWLLDYNDLFSYPASVLSFERWSEAGLAAALSARLAALGVNVQRLVAENGLIFLAPFIAIGAWRQRAHPFVRANALYLGLLLAAMTVVFPFVGSRGGLFHSGAALMPAFWVLAPDGIERATRWLGRRRGWNLREAGQVFGAAAVVLAAALSAGLFYLRQVRPAAAGEGWNAASQTHIRVAEALPPDRPRVAVNNPPGLFVASGASAIVIPNGGPGVLRAAMGRYQASWLVLEANHPPELEGLYRDPHSEAWLELRSTVRDPFDRPVYLFEVTGE